MIKKVSDKILVQYIKFQHDMLEIVLKGLADPVQLMDAQRPLIGQRRKYKNLKLKKTISIPVMKFKRDNFLVDGFNGTTILWLSPNVKNIFMSLVSEDIDFQGTNLEKLILKKDLDDYDIQKELGNKIQKPNDIVAEIKFITSQQPKGEKGGDLETPRISHIFYFEYKGRVWSLNLDWDAGDGMWLLYCYETDVDVWLAGSVVFTSATDES